MGSPLRVKVMPADLTGCGFYRVLEPCRVIADETTDVEITIVTTTEDEGALEVDLHGSMGRPHVVGVGDPHADVLVLQRPASRMLAEAIPYIQQHGCAVVCEYDDDFETIDPKNPAWKAYAPQLSPEQNHIWAKLCSQICDMVTVSTPKLVKKYGAHGMVQELPNYVPASYLDAVPNPELKRDLLMLGWAGNSKTHPGDLEVMASAPEGAIFGCTSSQEIGFRAIGDPGILKRVGLGVPDDDAFGVEVTGWVPLDRYPAVVASLDVGLAPLADTRFNGSKSWLKALEYAALGVPFVASPTQQYKALARLGAGDLVSSTTPSRSQWLRAIRKLVEDHVYRERRADEGREVARGLTIEGHAEEWVNAWHLARTIRTAR